MYSSNPRGVVRFINNLLIDREVYKWLVSKDQRGDISGQLPEMRIGLFVVTRSLQARWRSTYRALASSDALCRQVADWAKHELQTYAMKDERDEAGEGGEIQDNAGKDANQRP